MRGNLVKRLDVIKWIIFLIFTVLVCRLGYLQVLRGEHYLLLADNNRIKILPIKASRGIFYDRNGIPLVTERPSFNVEVDTYFHPLSDSTIIKLSKILGMKTDEVLHKVNRHAEVALMPVVIKSDVDSETLIQIEENTHDFKGIEVKAQPVRNYIYGNLAAHVIGYVGEIGESELKSKKKDGYRASDVVGKFGLEKVFDRYIRGTVGAKRIEVDVNGLPVKILNETQPKPGNNLELTLDYFIQQATEKAIDKRLSYLRSKLHKKANAAAAVVMNPNTGEIIAMASRPAFNPNLFNGGISKKNWNVLIDNPYSPMENRAISGEYPPGSIFKIITGTAALELEKVTLEEKILDTGKHWLIPKGNAGGEALGWISFHEALTKSDNVYFYEIGNRVGIDNLERYARLFGLGNITGIELSGEAKGLVANRHYKEETYKERWYLSETFDAAIGQGFQLITPLQAAMIISEVANGGYRYRPFLVRKIVSPGGRVIKTILPGQIGQVDISESSLAAIRNALYGVTLPGGTAASVFENFPVSVAGKTGTAENPHGDDHGWFIAYAPYKDPQVVVAVVVENGGYGVQSAAPIAKDILAAIFHIKDSSELRS